MKKIIEKINIFFKDEKGLSSVLWLIPMMSIAALITAFCLGVNQIYNVRDKAVDTLSRSTSIAVGATEQDVTIRDLYFIIPQSEAKEAVESNLLLDGYKKVGDEWIFNNDFSLSNVVVTGNSELLNISANLNVFMKWHLDTSLRVATIPVTTRARIVYYNY